VFLVLPLKYGCLLLLPAEKLMKASVVACPGWPPSGKNTTMTKATDAYLQQPGRQNLTGAAPSCLER
jgi:hypothetical protein